MRFMKMFSTTKIILLVIIIIVVFFVCVKKDSFEHNSSMLSLYFKSSNEQITRDIYSMKRKRLIYTCLNKNLHFDEIIKDTPYPDTFKIINNENKEQAFYMTISFDDHVHFLEWILRIEDETPLRIAMLNINEAMNMAELEMLLAGCYDY